MSVGLPSIPWSHSLTGGGSVWVWETPHFRVTVLGDTRSCYWRVEDLSTGTERIFSDGRTTTFAQAERQVRETIGKAYDPTLGYQVFAGSLATTFVISTGDQVDLGPYNGQQTEVTAITTEGGTVTFAGLAQVRNYEFVIVNDGQTVRISPSYIVDVRRAGAPSRQARRAEGGRVVAGAVVPGCTGRPGYLPGTVEHDGAGCPLHER